MDRAFQPLSAPLFPTSQSTVHSPPQGNTIGVCSLERNDRCLLAGVLTRFAPLLRGIISRWPPSGVNCMFILHYNYIPPRSTVFPILLACGQESRTDRLSHTVFTRQCNSDTGGKPPRSDVETCPLCRTGRVRKHEMLSSVPSKACLSGWATSTATRPRTHERSCSPRHLLFYQAMPIREAEWLALAYPTFLLFYQKLVWPGCPAC